MDLKEGAYTYFKELEERKKQFFFYLLSSKI